MITDHMRKNVLALDGGMKIELIDLGDSWRWHFRPSCGSFMVSPYKLDTQEEALVDGLVKAKRELEVAAFKIGRLLESEGYENL